MIFFISILYKKKTQSIYAVCHCLTEKKAMASPSEFGLAIKVTDGLKTLLSKLKSVNTSDLIVDVFTGLDITCSGREVKRVQVAEQPGGRWRDVELYESVQMLQSFNMKHVHFYVASFMLKVKKKKSRPTDQPSEK